MVTTIVKLSYLDCHDLYQFLSMGSIARLSTYQCTIENVLSWALWSAINTKVFIFFFFFLMAYNGI
jgi:hypothetical protein